MRFYVDRCVFSQCCLLLIGASFCSIAARLISEPLDSLAYCFFIAAILLIWIAIVLGLNALTNGMPMFFRQLIHWFYAQTLELFVLAMLVLLGVASFFRKSHPVMSFGKNQPILLVHGYLNAGFVWGYHKKYLSKNGFGPIYTIDLGHPFQSIRTYALKVQQKARQIAQENGTSELSLIGHSMGGLVSYYYTAKLAPAHSVSQVITIGSPLQGTRVAKIGLGQCTREMEINSNFLKELHESIELCSHVQFYNIASTTDELVIPYSSAILKSDSNHQFYLDDIGHASMLFSKRVSDQLCSWLRTDIK